MLFLLGRTKGAPEVEGYSNPKHEQALPEDQRFNAKPWYISSAVSLPYALITLFLYISLYISLYICISLYPYLSLSLSQNVFNS